MKRSLKILLTACGRQWVRREKEMRRLRRLAYEDELTGIGNLRAFREGMTRLMNAGERFALLYLDLDRFKEVNDRFGHLAGDRVLREVAAVLGELAAGRICAFRLGGDEFALVVPVDEGVGAVMELLRSEFTSSDRLRIGNLHVGASVGVARFPEDGGTCEQLIGCADRGMYVEKMHGVR